MFLKILDGKIIMLNRFKKIFFIIAALAAPIYAETVTYYTFVTYNINGKWELAKHINPANLAVGFYRFQIVRFSQIDETPHAWVIAALRGKTDGTTTLTLTWIALRGEFEFITDPKGGVKINKKYALDESQQVDSQSNVNNNNFSVWRDDVKNSWKNTGKQWVQPLVTQMSKDIAGDPEPNFIRFLLGKELYKEWKGKENKSYRLYRLHYTKPYHFFSNENDRKAFSHFINPTHEVVTDIMQLKEWVDSEESFTLAKYMGTANDKHKAFYGNFKTWFNQLSFDAKRIEEITWEIKALQEMVRQKTQEANQHANNAQDAVITAKNAGISTEEINRKKEAAKVAKKAEEKANQQARLFKQSVTAVKKALKANNLKEASDEIEKANKTAKITENAAKTAENAAKEAKYTKSFFALLLYSFLGLFIFLSIITWLLAKKRRIRHHNHEDDFVDELFDNNKENKSASKKSKPESSKNKPSTTISKEEFDQLNKRLLALENQKPFSQEEFDQFNKRLLTLENQKPFSQNIDNTIKNQASSQDELSNDELLNIIAKILNNSLSKIASKLFQHSELKDAMTNQIKIDLDKKFNIDKIKAILLSMKSVNESALNTLDTNVDPCTFITNVVANCLKLNQPDTHYQRLTNAIANLTGGKAALIISSVGDDIRPEEHNVVGQQTVTKGKLNVVASLIRPGVKCDNIIKRKAEVIQNV
jgi:hypothetical protein